MQALGLRHVRTAAVAMLLPLMLAACVSGPQGEQGMVLETAVRGQSIAGARCSATIGSLRWDVTTPAILGVTGARGELHIVCDMPGFRTSELYFRPEPGITSSGSVGFGSRGYGSGVGLGLSFPLGSAAAPYPKRLVIDLNPV